MTSSGHGRHPLSPAARAAADGHATAADGRGRVGRRGGAAGAGGGERAAGIYLYTTWMIHGVRVLLLETNHQGLWWTIVSVFLPLLTLLHVFCSSTGGGAAPRPGAGAADRAQLVRRGAHDTEDPALPAGNTHKGPAIWGRAYTFIH